MVIEPATTSLATATPIGELRAEIIAALGRLDAEVTDESAGTIQARSGRKVLSRLYLGPLARDSFFPVDHTVVLTPEADGTRLEITITQAFGKGLTGVGMKDRYERILQDNLSALVESVG